MPERGIHFDTVTSPNVGQSTTFAPESSLLWESSTLTVAWSALRPTSVLKWIPQPDMGGKESVSYPANTDRHILSAAS